MRAVVQRVNRASVDTAGETIGAIDRGLLVFIGIEDGDSQTDADYLVDKVIGLRVFDDENAIPNRSVVDISGSVLLISQFTLCADARHGKRPQCGQRRPSRPRVEANPSRKKKGMRSFAHALSCPGRNAAFCRGVNHCLPPGSVALRRSGGSPRRRARGTPLPRQHRPPPP